jgi:hypothetical protein
MNVGGRIPVPVGGGASNLGADEWAGAGFAMPDGGCVVDLLEPGCLFIR